MGYTNSSLVNYKRLSPNNSGLRTHNIDTITIHMVWGQCSVETLGEIFAPSSRQASSNYGIGPDGRIGMYCEEKNRSWCSSSPSNDQRAITIETASDRTYPYAVTDAAYKSLIKLCADICKRNGKKKMIWCGSLGATNNRSFASGEMRMTLHKWFASMECPGQYLESRMGDIANQVNKLLDSGKWKKEAGNWYYIKDGEKYTGWLDDGGTWYYLDSDGVMLKGWQRIKGKWYYLDKSGAMLTGWQKIKGKWYYLKSSGAMKTGWLEDEGKKYYLADNGEMVTGTQTIDGTTYKFAKNGALIDG